MPLSPSRLFALLAAALCLCFRLHAAPTMRASLSSSLDAESLSQRLSLERGDSRLALRLDADEDGGALSGSMELSGSDEPRSRIALGPGSPSGLLRLVVDPASVSSLSPGPLVELDSSLETRTSALGLDAGPASLFAFSRGSDEAAIDSCAGGAALTFAALDAGRDRVAADFIGTASFPREAAAGSGWSPKPAASPALSASPGGEALLDAALALRRESVGQGSTALVAAAASYGRLAGPGFALRLDSRESSGPWSLRLSAGASGPRFKRLYGELPESLLGATAALGFSKGGPRVSLGLNAEASNNGARYAPLWGGSGRASFYLPLVLDSGRYLEASASFADPPSCSSSSEATRELRIELGRRLSRRGITESASFSAKLCFAEPATMIFAAPADASDEAAVESLELSLAASAGRSERGLKLGCEFALAIPSGEAEATEVSASYGLAFSLPCGPGGILSLQISSPDAGIKLAPRLAEVGASCDSAGIASKAGVSAIDSALNLRIVYKASLLLE
jgi:hypothetical protein